MMVDSAYIVKSTALRAFTGSFEHFADRHMEDVHKKFNAEKIFFDKLTGF